MTRMRLPGRYRLKNLILRRNWHRGIVARVGLGGPVHMELHLSDHVQRNIFFDNYYEKNESGYWKRAATGKRTVLDIGGNVGYYSLLASPLIDPGGVIYMFEPLRLNLERAARNIGLSNATNIRPVKHAVSDSPGTVTIRIESEDNRGGSGMRANIGEQDTVETVEAVTIDDFLQRSGAGPVDLIKVDVEGAEPLVLRGAARTLTEQSPEIMMEVCDETLVHMNFTLKDVYETLRGYGYHPYLINDDLSITPLREQVSRIGLVLFKKQAPGTIAGKEATHS